MILQPTMKLRWIDRSVLPPNGGYERVLQQWWQDINSEYGEWKDVEVVDLRHPLTPDECFKK